MRRLRAPRFRWGAGTCACVCVCVMIAVGMLSQHKVLRACSAVHGRSASHSLHAAPALAQRPARCNHWLWQVYFAVPAIPAVVRVKHWVGAGDALHALPGAHGVHQALPLGQGRVHSQHWYTCARCKRCEDELECDGDGTAPDGAPRAVPAHRYTAKSTVGCWKKLKVQHRTSTKWWTVRVSSLGRPHRTEPSSTLPPGE